MDSHLLTIGTNVKSLSDHLSQPDDVRRFDTPDEPESWTNVRFHGIGEEFRHIIYHIKDCKYYRYLSPDDTSMKDLFFLSESHS